MCPNLFNIPIYFSSLHVSDILVPLIVIKLPKPCVAGTCHTVWTASGLLVRVNKKQFFAHLVYVSVPEVYEIKRKDKEITSQ